MSTVDFSLTKSMIGSAGTDIPVHSARALERLLPFVGGLLVLVVDAALVLGAFVLALWIRFLPGSGAEDAPLISFNEYMHIAWMVSFVTVLLGAFHGLYDEEHPPAWPARLKAILSSVSTALVIAVSASYLIGDHHFSRLWFGVGWLLAVTALAVWRMLAHRLYALLRDAVAPANRVLIVGANRLAAELALELGTQFRVVGMVDNGSDLGVGGPVPLLGPISQLEFIVQAYGVDELVIALPSERREQVNRLIARGFGRRVKVKFLPDFHATGLLPDRFEVHRLGGRPYLGYATAARVSWMKRAIDIVLTFGGLLLLAPVMCAVAVAIKLDSPGPVFYRQRRVGKDGRTFWMLKFRSMHRDADRLLEQLRANNEAVGPLFKIRHDPRITRVGRVLRRLSLDELPQLVNVLLGEMSLVGPRPPLPSEVERYEDWQFGRLRTVPGITGLWQVSGRSEVPFHDMVRLDLHYVRNWTLALDFEILVRTIPAVLTSRGAY